MDTQKWATARLAVIDAELEVVGLLAAEFESRVEAAGEIIGPPTLNNLDYEAKLVRYDALAAQRAKFDVWRKALLNEKDALQE